jgi:hypothetical protein
MVNLYAPDVVSRTMVKELDRIKAKLRSKTCDSCFNSTYVAKPGDGVQKLYPKLYEDLDEEEANLFMAKPSEREERRLEIQNRRRKRARYRFIWLIVMCLALPLLFLLLCGCGFAIYQLEKMQQEAFDNLKHRPIKIKHSHYQDKAGNELEPLQIKKILERKLAV